MPLSHSARLVARLLFQRLLAYFSWELRRRVRGSGWCGKPKRQAPWVLMPQYSVCLCTNNSASRALSSLSRAETFVDRRQLSGPLVMYLSLHSSAQVGTNCFIASSSDQSGTCASASVSSPSGATFILSSGFFLVLLSHSTTQRRM